MYFSVSLFQFNNLTSIIGMAEISSKRKIDFIYNDKCRPVHEWVLQQQLMANCQQRAFQPPYQQCQRLMIPQNGISCFKFCMQRTIAVFWVFPQIQQMSLTSFNDKGKYGKTVTYTNILPTHVMENKTWQNSCLCCHFTDPKGQR